jgi:hypothetical protein
MAAVGEGGLHPFLDDDGVAVGEHAAEVDGDVGDEAGAELRGEELHDAVASGQVVRPVDGSSGGIVSRGEPLGIRGERSAAGLVEHL